MIISMEKSLKSMELILDKCDADLDNCGYGNNGLLQSMHSSVSQIAFFTIF